MSDFLTGIWGRAHLAHDSGSSNAAAGRVQRSAEDTAIRLDRALLTMEAMWTLLRDRLGATEEELLERVVELDLTDGVLDGKIRRAAMECSACERRIPSRFTRCLYCGTDVQHDPFA